MKGLNLEALRWFIHGLPGGIPFQHFTEEDIRNALDDVEKVINICRKFLQKKGVLKEK